MKDMIKAKFPQIQEISLPRNGKVWYIPQGNMTQYIGFSLDEINAVQNAIKLMELKNMADFEELQSLVYKVKASMGKDAISRIEPDAEFLM